MGFGMPATPSNISLDQINNIMNTSSVSELFINVNHVVYEGWLYFVLLVVAWFIMYIAANNYRDQPMNNLMLSGAVVSIISLLMRAVNIAQGGIVRGLLSDFQMWLFPVLTILIATMVYATAEK